MDKGRAQWATSIGFILAAAGSAIGLGNIWKFPRLAFEHGGGAFILVYVFIVFIIGTTVMITEFVLGRSSRRNAMGALRSVNKNFAFIGGMGVLTAFIILCYYSHVGGWVLKYFVAYVTGADAVYADPTDYFFVEVLGEGTPFPVQGAILYPLIFMLLTGWFVMQGITRGIEKANKVLMPALFIILMILSFRGIIFGDSEGLKYLLAPDFSKLDGAAILAAMGQAFFSLSLGMSIMITFGSYLPKEENLVKSTFTICGIETLISLLAGFAMIPMAFSAGLNITEAGNAGFAFISLATAFQNMPLGTLFGALFYLLLLFAAFTSAISFLEGTTAYVTEEWNISRPKAVFGLCAFMYFFGMLYTASQACKNIKGIWLDAGGITYPVFGDFMEFITDKLLMPLGALLMCIVVGWVWGIDKAAEEITSVGKYEFKLRSVYAVLVKFVAPIAILIIMLGGFGVFG